MKKKLWIIPAMLVLVLLVMQGCSSTGNEPAETATAAPTQAVTETPATTEELAPTATESAELTLTLDELKQYDGQNGNPAYIAVDGVIYDVSNVPQWNSGGHNGYAAGNDLTEEIKTVSPHGVSKLRGLPVVGKLAE